MKYLPWEHLPMVRGITLELTCIVVIIFLTLSFVGIAGAALYMMRREKPRNPRHLDRIEGGRMYKALRAESKSVLDALLYVESKSVFNAVCRVKKCFRHSR